MVVLNFAQAFFQSINFHKNAFTFLYFVLKLREAFCLHLKNLLEVLILNNKNFQCAILLYKCAQVFTLLVDGLS